MAGLPDYNIHEKNFIALITQNMFSSQTDWSGKFTCSWRIQGPIHFQFSRILFLLFCLNHIFTWIDIPSSLFKLYKANFLFLKYFYFYFLGMSSRGQECFPTHSSGCRVLLLNVCQLQDRTRNGCMPSSTWPCFSWREICVCE